MADLQEIKEMIRNKNVYWIAVGPTEENPCAGTFIYLSSNQGFTRAQMDMLDTYFREKYGEVVGEIERPHKDTPTTFRKLSFIFGGPGKDDPQYQLGLRIIEDLEIPQRGIYQAWPPVSDQSWQR